MPFDQRLHSGDAALWARRPAPAATRSLCKAASDANGMLPGPAGPLPRAAESRPCVVPRWFGNGAPPEGPRIETRRAAPCLVLPPGVDPKFCPEGGARSEV